jgi:uncharacterized membrane protein YkoI
MQRKVKLGIAAGAIVVVASAIGGGVAVASGDDDEGSRPIQGTELERARAAALAETGGGRVTETEVGDEDSEYEVEVTLDDGRQVDVQLDAGFRVVQVIGDEEGD